MTEPSNNNTTHLIAVAKQIRLQMSKRLAFLGRKYEDLADKGWGGGRQRYHVGSDNTNLGDLWPLATV